MLRAEAVFVLIVPWRSSGNISASWILVDNVASGGTGRDSGIGDITLGFRRLSVAVDQGQDGSTSSGSAETQEPRIEVVVSDPEESTDQEEMAESSKNMVGPIAKLDKSNYGRWIIDIKDVLSGSNLWTIVTGDETKPNLETTGGEAAIAASKKKHDDWIRRDGKARRILRGLIDDVSYNHVRDCETSAEIMVLIREDNEPKSTDVLMSGCLEFLNVKWTQDDDVQSFLAKLSVISTRVNACGNANVKLTDEWIIAMTLRSLPSTFGSFVQTWRLTTDGTGTLKDFRKKLITAERGFNDAVDEDDGGSGDDGCSAGDAFSARRFQKKQWTTRGPCHFCKKDGHWKKDCPDWKKADQNCSTGDKKDEKPNVTDGVYGAYSAADLQQEDLIIVDCGASDHLTRNLFWFSMLKPLRSHRAYRTSGDKVILATHEGDILTDVSPDGINWTRKWWKNVRYVKDMDSPTLLATRVLADQGFEFSHDAQTMVLQKDGITVIGGKRVGTHYTPFIKVVLPETKAVKEREQIAVWFPVDKDSEEDSADDSDETEEVTLVTPVATSSTTSEEEEIVKKSESEATSMTTEKTDDESFHDAADQACVLQKSKKREYNKVDSQLWKETMMGEKDSLLDDRDVVPPDISGTRRKIS